MSLYESSDKALSKCQHSISESSGSSHSIGSSKQESSRAQLAESSQIKSTALHSSTIAAIIAAKPSALLEKESTSSKGRETVEPSHANEELEMDNDDVKVTRYSTLYTSILITGVFIAICILENSVEGIYQMHNNIMSTYLST
jgi:hypothetical protein